jgi:hypothetical protein
MITKYDKKGPELFLITEEMLTGLETLAAQFKKHHDNYNYNFLTLVKTGLTKIIAITPVLNDIAKQLKESGSADIKLAEYIEQLFPVTKENQG